MKNITLTILLAFIFQVSFSQEILYEDDFSTDDFSWKSAAKYYDPSFKDGKMVLSGRSEEDIAIVSTEIILDPARDFVITSQVSYRGVSGENPFGMVFTDESHSDDPRHYFFMVYPGEGFEIYYSASTGFDLRFVPYFPFLKNKGFARNINEIIDFTLKNTGGKWEFTINGEPAWGKVNPGICVTSVGFFTSGFNEIKADYFVVRQDGWRDIKLADESNVKYEKENLGPNINTKATELLPIISADGEVLFLCVMDDTANTGGPDDQDIWYSEMDGEGNWKKRMNLGFPLNNKNSNFVNYISPDNNTLLVGNQYDSKGNLSGDGLSVARREGSGWKIPEPVMIDNYYNSNRFISVSYSPSGRTLVLSIERDDTHGFNDLYVSHIKDDGTWSEPLNMGPGINTFSNEMSPFLAADNITLYFATQGRPGYGNYDIFITRRLDESWTNWSEPKNMGPNINTAGGDAYFTIPVIGEYSYLVSSRNSFGSADIFRVKVAEEARPIPVALINGKVVDKETSEGLGAVITYFDLETNEEIGTARSDPRDGSYQIALPSGHIYSYSAMTNGYYGISENIDLREMVQYSNIRKDLVMAPLEVGGTIRLNNIFFEFDKADLLPASIIELDNLVRAMNANPKMTIIIKGHTDFVGSDAYNQKLSEERAKAVFTYLQSKGLGHRASSIGYGESMPVATNETDEGRAQNRRVEFEILTI